MRFAQPTSALSFSALTFSLIGAFLLSAAIAVAQPSVGRTTDYLGDNTPFVTLAPAAPSGTSTIVTMADRADLSEFYKMIEVAGLRNRLRRPTEAVTVFAPTNAALASLAAPVRERLHQVGAPIVKAIVRTHIVEGILTPDQLIDGLEIETIGGQKLRVVRQADGSILLDGVYRLRDAGQQTTNGIVYTLDQVISPQ
jgi:uncharacterized surface protein with fasciclin (FAS1) repeats